MADWLRRSPGRPAPTLFELHALHGADRGRVLPVGEGEWELGRGEAGERRERALLLSERTVSSHQARLHCANGELSIEHASGATNPTCVNGSPIERARLREGDRLEIGEAALVVRRAKATVRVAAPSADSTVQVSADDATRTTVTRPLMARLVCVSAAATAEGHAFPIGRGQTAIGRSADSDVRLLEEDVSRKHAVINWDGDAPILEHRSATNPTYLNGEPIEGPRALVDGDEIQIAHQVRLRLEITDPAASRRAAATRAPGRLLEKMEERLRLEHEIKQEFERTGSFLDVDVVGSGDLKRSETDATHVAVSFERFRAWVTKTVEEQGGRVLNSNGDEVMCFFDAPDDAARAGIAMLRGLDGFNSAENLLRSPFRVRVGVHTGTCAVDLERGVAYSLVLDVAGHLQKQAETNGLLISQETWHALSDREAFAPAGELERDRVPVYRWSPGRG
jgi:pSer/pThr/pTyr-binding forkhead associated (FHA) protein